MLQLNYQWLWKCLVNMWDVVLPTCVAVINVVILSSQEVPLQNFVIMVTGQHTATVSVCSK